MALTASPSDQALLLELQAFDTKLQQIAHRAKSLAEHAVLSGLAVERNAIGVMLAEQSGTLEDSNTELKRIESDVAVVEARIKRDLDRLQTTSSVRDVQALEQELVALRKRQGDLEEIELTVMERVENDAAVVASTAAQMKELEDKISGIEAERDAALATIGAERDNATANRDAIAAKIPADLLALYEKIRARYGAGASLLRGGVSSASGMKLNENDMVAIRAAAPDEVLFCPESSAILVRTEESGL
jgi:hypothetical protein